MLQSATACIVAPIIDAGFCVLEATPPTQRLSFKLLRCLPLPDSDGQRVQDQCRERSTTNRAHTPSIQLEEQEVPAQISLAALAGIARISSGWIVAVDRIMSSCTCLGGEGAGCMRRAI